MTRARRRFAEIVTLTVVSSSIIALLLYTSEVTQASRSGLTMCISVVIPTLFPFMVFTSLFIKTGGADYIGDAVSPILGRLFKVSRQGVSAFVLGLLGGYPMGARVIAELFDEGCINKNEAEHLLGFCSNSGPAFIFGACGAGVFNSVRVGVLLFVSHVVSAIFVGIIFRRSSPCGDSVSVKNIHVYKPLTFALTESVRDAVQGIINICGFVIIFQVLSAVIRSSGLILTGDLGTLTEGFLELTAGIYRLNVSNYITAMTIASFLIGWGGLCVHCQALSYTVPRGLRAHKYFIGKLLHGIVSAGVTYIAVSLFG